MKNRLACTAFGLVISMALPSVSGAQQSDDVLVDVGDCAEIESRDQRLECYEERVQQVLETRETEDTATTAAAEAPEPPLSRRAARRAARAEERQAETRAEQRREEAAAESRTSTEGQISATVTAVREMEPNHLMVTLDNGQVWRQNRARRYLLEVGTEVTLRPTGWGPSYRLTDPARGGFIQVERVR